MVEMNALLKATSIAKTELETFLADAAWCYPKASATKSRQLHRIFNARRSVERKPYALRGTCSEFLGLYGMMRCFVALRLGAVPAHEAFKLSFDSACEVVDAVLALKQGLVAIGEGADRLDSCVRRHLALHRTAYGDLHVKPKHHWVVDVAEQVRRDGCVIDAFVIERTHLRVKRVAEPVQNTIAFERSVLASLVNVTQHQADLEEDGLIGHTDELRDMQGVTIASKLRIWGLTLDVGDFIVRDGTAARVVACAKCSGELFVIVHPYLVRTAVGRHCVVAVEEPQLIAWKAAAVQFAVAWRRSNDGTVLVVTR